jgi:predicted transcriptional regulator
MAEGIPIDVQRFIEQHIRSVAQLDLLLLLRTRPEQPWTPDDIAREMRVEPSWAQGELLNLSNRGLVEKSSDSSTEGGTSPRYKYQPRTSELERAVTDVAQAYLLQRVRLIEEIYRQPSEHIRAFADAFRLRKEPDHG